MPANFKVNGSDLEDLFIPRELFTQGGLWGWGSNNYGQLGTNNTTGTSSPVQTIASGITWKQVSAGRVHTTAIKTDGTLWVWGSNGNGQLGDNTVANKSSPVQTISAGTNWKLVAGGAYSNHTTAIKTDGTLWVWGLNGSGQLGVDDITHRSSPVQTVSGGTNWKLVAGGRVHTTAIKTDGTLWVWGLNGSGQLGANDTTHRSSPVQTVSGGTNWKLVAGGNDHTAAIKTDGTLWVWGNNGYGRLGTNNTTAYSSPVQTIAAGTNWKQVSGGEQHTAAVKTDGTLWVWGNNGYGRLGTNNTTSYSSPVQTVSAGTNWKQVSCGRLYTAAIKTDGTLWTWGRNSYGNLGDNTSVNKSSPVQTIAAGTNWKQVSCGANGSGVAHTVAITDIY